MKNHPVFGFFCLAAVVAAWHLVPWSAGTEVHAQTPSVSREISGNGIIEATEVEITTKVTARIASLAVRVGEPVRAGQQVAVLENEDYAGQLEQASASLELALARLAELENGTRPEEVRRARAQFTAAGYSLKQAQARNSLVREGPRKEQVAQLKANLSQARSTLADAEREMKRAEKLEGEGAAPGQQLDQARTRWEVAQAQVKVASQRLAEAEAGARGQERNEAEAFVEFAQAQLDAASAALDLALAGARRETIDAARAQVALARGQLRTAQAMFDFTRLSSPINGRVTERNLEPGELVTPGMAVVQIADLDNVWMKVYIPATEVGLIKFGQTADVVCDSLPDRKFPGKVVEVAEKPEFTPKNVQTRDERTKQIFWVKIEIPNPDLDLKPGMPGDAVIHVSPQK